MYAQYLAHKHTHNGMHRNSQTYPQYLAHMIVFSVKNTYIINWVQEHLDKYYNMNVDKFWMGLHITGMVTDFYQNPNLR